MKYYLVRDEKHRVVHVYKHGNDLLQSTFHYDEPVYGLDVFSGPSFGLSKLCTVEFATDDQLIQKLQKRIVSQPTSRAERKLFEKWMRSFQQGDTLSASKNIMNFLDLSGNLSCIGWHPDASVKHGKYLLEIKQDEIYYVFEVVLPTV